MKLVVALLSLFVFFTTTQSVSAARLLPRHKSTTKTTTVATGTSPRVSVQFLKNKSGIRASFSNMSTAKSVSYTLSYETNGKPEGVVGSANVSKGSETKELLFGTCSSGTCRYHSGLKNVKFVVTSKLTNGKTSVKRYSIKI